MGFEEGVVDALCGMEMLHCFARWHCIALDEIIETSVLATDCWPFYSYKASSLELQKADQFLVLSVTPLQVPSRLLPRAECIVMHSQLPHYSLQDVQSIRKL